MSVLDRGALEASPLADLHAIASELSMDGYRRLRKADLIDAIIARQEGDEPTVTEEVAAEPPEAAAAEPDEAEAGQEPTTDETDETTGTGRRRRGRRGGRARGSAAGEAAVDATAETAVDATAETAVDATAETAVDASAEAAVDATAETAADATAETAVDATGEGEGEGEEQAAGAEQSEEPAPRARRGEERAPRARRGEGRTSRGKRSEEPAPRADGGEEKPVAEAADPDALVEGVVDLLPNGSGFVRVSPPDPSDSDVYVSAAQVKRCELVSGDVVTGPRRAPQRSERFASLLRIDTINGNPVADLGERGRFDDLPAVFPTERLRFGTDDPTLQAIESLTPFGRGSRVVITGGLWAGKSYTLRQLALALAGMDGVTLFVALAGVRPEELSEWNEVDGLPAPTAATSFAASSDAQDHAVELAIEQARRVAARGGDAVVLIDTLDGLHALSGRKALAAARNLAGAGSLTVIATSLQPLGGETTVIALDRELTAAGRFPALDLALSGTLRADLLVGEDGAREIAEARSQALAAV